MISLGSDICHPRLRQWQACLQFFGPQVFFCQAGGFMLRQWGHTTAAGCPVEPPQGCHSDLPWNCYQWDGALYEIIRVGCSCGITWFPLVNVSAMGTGAEGGVCWVPWLSDLWKWCFGAIDSFLYLQQVSYIWTFKLWVFKDVNMHSHMQSHELLHTSTLSYVCIDYKGSCFCVLYYIVLSRVGFPGGSVVKNLPANQEIWVWSLGREDPL